jgi:membrane peptidoglycan carboxypeptidase
VDHGRPDDVTPAADVVPRGLALDPARTRLPLLELGEPFTARIHLPRDRVVERSLTLANPHYLPLASIDTLLTRAVLTNEDGSFFRHGGFNLEAVRDAIAANIKAGAFRRGAGTITMQLVRNLFLGHERTLSRKGQEVVLAWVLEHLTPVSKERMLEIYLNIIEWGPGVHGADEAAWYYFGHDAGTLTVDEALFLATVIPAPAKWRYRFDDTGMLRPWARAQMHFIGRAMIAKGWLDPETLPPVDALHVMLAGPARGVVFPAIEPVAAPFDSSEA